MIATHEHTHLFTYKPLTISGLPSGSASGSALKRIVLTTCGSAYTVCPPYTILYSIEPSLISYPPPVS